MKHLTVTSILVLVLAAMASADTITLSVDNDGWQEAIWGDPASVATSGNDYVVDGSTAANNTRIETAVFAGDSLSLINGAQALVKADGEANFILDGGEIRHGQASTTYKIGGTIQVLGDSTIDKNNGNLEIDALVSGGAKLSLVENSTFDYIKFTNASNTFTGTFDLSSGTGVFYLDFDYDEASGASLNMAAGAKLLLDQNLSFASVVLDGTPLGIGTYSATDDAISAYMQDTAATGSLTVVPEPTTMALVGLGGLLAARRRRK